MSSRQIQNIRVCGALPGRPVERMRLLAHRLSAQSTAARSASTPGPCRASCSRASSTTCGPPHVARARHCARLRRAVLRRRRKIIAKMGGEVRKNTVYYFSFSKHATLHREARRGLSRQLGNTPRPAAARPSVQVAGTVLQSRRGGQGALLGTTSRCTCRACPPCARRPCSAWRTCGSRRRGR